jgi:hypothetical protein
MQPQFRNEMTYRDGSRVEVQVGFEQGIAGKMDERRALERAAEIIGERLGELGPEE